MKTKYILMLFAFLICGTVAKSQDVPLKLNLNYNYSFPLSSFNNHLVKDASPRGFTSNLMYDVNPKISVGLGIGYQDYYQKNDRQLYKYGQSQDISAVLTNSVQIIPVTARMEYTPLGASPSAVQPYLALAAGFNFVNYDQYLGQFLNHTSATGFRALAGVGVKIPFGKNNGWGADLGASYDYAPFKKWGLNDLNTANVHAGVYIPLK